MRQWLVLTGFLFMVSGVNAQSFFSPKPPTDTILQHWPQVDFIQIKDSSGFVLEEGYLKKGERDGVWTTFHRSGVPHTVTSYRMGKKNGSSLKMGADGYLEESATYMDDVLHGPFRTYLKGARMGKEIYYKQGIEDGMRKVYYFDAGLQEEAEIRNGKRNGPTTWYYKNGQKAVEYLYVNDIAEGFSRTYSENGQPNREGNFKNGLEEGLWKEFDNDGKLNAEGRYSLGLREGVWKIYQQGASPIPVEYQHGEAVNKSK